MLKLLSSVQRRKFQLTLVSPIIAWLPAALLFVTWLSWFAAMRIFDAVDLPNYFFLFRLLSG